ncbi:MAG: nucleotidyl transferase AbiEii/AbiGii toxin family protein [Bacteroidia bacterium]|nr:nucleotidyl transferase AbiEii/AbiGii toxin family protein [Bacteroidia bacterium]
MLQYTAIDKRTLELLKSLMQQYFLTDFNLVGGTALGLQLGHRISVDLDLFTDKIFNPSEIRMLLEQHYQLQDVSENKGGLNQKIAYPENSNNYIKVDIVKYSYQLINPPLNIDGIRLLSKEDIIPMKLAAIANRGAKKDFYDIYFLLQEYTLKEMISSFEQKFSNYNNFYVIKSLTYFEDAENDISPKCLKKCSWDEIKQFIQIKVKEYV